MRSLVVLLIAVSGCVGVDPAQPTEGEDANARMVDSSASTSSSFSTTATTSCDARCACPYVDGCGVPEYDAEADIRFVLNASYVEGESVHWVLRNHGSRDYGIESPASCSMEVYTQSGRRIWLGPCYTDFKQTHTIPAGAEANLGSWPAGECVEDDRKWYAGSCARWERLGPGTYEVRRSFCAMNESQLDCKIVSRTGGQIVLT